MAQFIKGIVIVPSNGSFLWLTLIIVAYDKVFYLTHKKDRGNHMFETVILGSEEKCSNHLASAIPVALSHHIRVYCTAL